MTNTGGIPSISHLALISADLRELQAAPELPEQG
jgi:hypothetical protein